MRIKNGFELRKICGENIVIAHGVENIDFTKVITLNESAAFIWQQVEGKEFTVEDLADALVREYGIDKELALKDSQNLLDSWRAAGVLDE